MVRDHSPAARCLDVNVGRDDEGEGLASGTMTRIRSSTLCTAVEWVSRRRTLSGRASIVPMANMASNEARIATVPTRRGPPG